MNLVFKDLKENYVFQRIGSYLFYGILTLSAYYMLTSINIALQFLLGQHFSSIDSWIERHNFSLVSLSKLVAFYITIKFLQLRNLEKRKIRDLYLDNNFRLNYYVVVVILFYLGILYVFGRPEKVWHEHSVLEISMLFDATWGGFCFYFFDFLIINAAFGLLPKKKFGNELLLVFILNTLIFFIVTKNIIPYKREFPYYSLMNFIVLMSILMKNHKNFTDVGLLILLVFVPINTLLGVNIFWGDPYSPFQFRELTSFLYFLTSLVAFIYILVHDKNLNIIFSKYLNTNKSIAEKGK